MIFDFLCKKCGKTKEKNVSAKMVIDTCEFCGGISEKQFHACSNIHIPSYFHTSKSDIFTDTEWAALKKDPNIERAK